MSTARIVRHNGLPKLEIDGRIEAPIFFFVNTDIKTHFDVSALGVQYSRDAGMHLYSVCCVLPVNPDLKINNKRNFQIAFDALDVAIDNDDQAKILIRINVSIYGESALEWGKRYPDDLMRFLVNSNDGSSMVNENGEWTNTDTMVTITSDDWLREAAETLREFINEIEHHEKYSKHVIGYHIAGAETGEWFHFQMREKGLDVSNTNLRTYRRWLKEKYGTVDRLNNAWGKNFRGYDEVPLPVDIPGNDRSKSAERTLFISDKDAEYIDYSLYCSEIMADRILKLARVAKSLVEDRKLIVFFYGYYFDLYDSRTGHFSLNKILESPDIDALSSPICYTDRNEGGVGAYMSPVESIHSYGKLWLVENDLRTFMTVRQSPFFDWVPPIKSLENVIQVYKREAGSLLVHGTGCWYMDLFAAGWQAHPLIWKAIRKIKDLVEQNINQTSQLCPDVAVLVDEKSMAVCAHAEAVGMNLLYKTRLEFYRAGVSFGLYELKDFIDGKVPSAKLAVLLNPFNLDMEMANALRRQLDKQNCSVLWMHGLGITPGEAFNLVTGMRINQIDGEMLSLKMDVLPQIQVKDNVIVSQKGIDIPYILGVGMGNIVQESNPAYYVEDAKTVLATYSEGELSGKISFAVNEKAAFFGGLSLNADIIMMLASIFGIHIYNHDKLAMHIGDKVICVHNAEKPNETTIYLKEPKKVCEWTSLDEIISASEKEPMKFISESNSLTLKMKPFETKLLFLM